MSGGDGKGHNSGAHSTGGVNGTSGKGGLGGTVTVLPGVQNAGMVRQK